MVLKKILMLKKSLVEGGKEVEEEIKDKKELGTFQLFKKIPIFKKIPKGSVPIEALVKASMSAMEHVVVASGTQKKGDAKCEEGKIPLKD